MAQRGADSLNRLALLPRSPKLWGELRRERRFLYASQSSTGLLWGFVVVDGGSGNLTPVPGAPFLCGGTCHGVAGDDSGKYVYAAYSHGVQAYQIDGVTAALTSINGVTPAAVSIALVPAAGSPAATLQILPPNPTMVALNQQFTAKGIYSDGS